MTTSTTYLNGSAATAAAKAHVRRIKGREYAPTRGVDFTLEYDAKVHGYARTARYVLLGDLEGAE